MKTQFFVDPNTNSFTVAANSNMDQHHRRNHIASISKIRCTAIHSPSLVDRDRSLDNSANQFIAETIRARRVHRSPSRDVHNFRLEHRNHSIPDFRGLQRNN